MLTESLRDLPGREIPRGGLAGLEARLEADPTQEGSGLRATLALVSASEPVEVLNPFDLLQWQLLDESGAPLEVPSRPPNLRIHRPASTPWKLDSAVPIVEVRRDAERLDAADLDSATVGLEPGSELAVTFEFDRILRGGTPVEMPSGEYRLICLATLIDAQHTERSRIVRCDPLRVRFNRRDAAS